MHAFGQVNVDLDDDGYLKPLLRDTRLLAEQIEGSVVLLGSIATGKYVDPLTEILGERLQIPVAFVGKGDMSRGKLMLERAESGEELILRTTATRAGRIHRARIS